MTRVTIAAALVLTAIGYGAPAAGQETIETSVHRPPDELQMLKPWVGQWDSKIVTGPLKEPSKQKSSTGMVSIRWILDGQFLMITTENEDMRYIWVIGYDAAKKQFRRTTFTSAGQVSESFG